MEFLFTLFGVSALPWAVPVARRGSLIGLATLVLIVGMIAGPMFYALDLGVQLSLDRILLALVGGVVLMRWRLGEFEISRPNRYDWALLALAGWLLIRALPAPPSPGGESPVSRWLSFVAMPLAFYGIARLVPPTRRDLLLFLDLMIGLGIYLAATALLEVSGWHGLVFPRYIVDPAEWEFFGRGRGPFMNPVGNGIAMTAALAATAGRWDATGRPGRLGLIGIGLLIVAGIGCTLTRSVWIGMFLWAGILSWGRCSRPVKALGLAAVVLLAALLATGLKDELLHLRRDQHLSAADAAKSVELRPLLAIVAWEMFLDRPLAGHGYGGYEVAARPYHTVRDHGLPLEQARPYVQHNVWLSLLVDSGMPGLGLCLVWLAGASAAAWPLAVGGRAGPGETGLGFVAIAVFTAYAVNGMFHDVGVIPMMNALLFWVAGLTISRRTDRLTSPPGHAGFASR